MLDAWQYLINHPEKLVGWTLAHLWIILVAIAIAIILGVVVGIYITGKGKEHIADTVLYLAEIMMTVPSLALFGLLMLILGIMGLKTFGFLPAVIALIVYGQLPILRNTYTAIRGVDPAMIEAGKGMGMSERQLLFKVKLPLAVPVIMAGLRNAIVLIIGIAAIAAMIGAGLGRITLTGMFSLQPLTILQGVAPTAALAITLGFILERIEKWMTPRGLKVKAGIS